MNKMNRNVRFNLFAVCIIICKHETRSIARGASLEIWFGVITLVTAINVCREQ